MSGSFSRGGAAVDEWRQHARATGKSDHGKGFIALSFDAMFIAP
jgi:hypothetical protein